jgi:hypothetical protein
MESSWKARPLRFFAAPSRWCSRNHREAAKARRGTLILGARPAQILVCYQVALPELEIYRVA